MSNIFLLGSLIGRLNLAIIHRKLFIIHKKSKNLELFLNILVKENIIKNYVVNNNYFIIFLKFKNSISFIRNIKLLSKPGKKYYINLYKLNSLIDKNKNTTLYFLYTTKGILTGQNAKIQKIGGELLFQIKF